MKHTPNPPRILLIFVLVAAPSVARAQFDTADWPAGCDPRAVGERLVQNLLARPAFRTKAEGAAVHYAEACTYLGALRFTHRTGREDLQRQVLDRLDELLLSVDGRRRVPYVYHVDSYMFGAVPLEAHRITGERFYRLAGLNYADKQWRDAREDGLTKQTRFWIDDVYMIGVLQTQAHRVTGDAAYADQAARQAEAYAVKLQQPNGLFHHGKDSTRFWGRGNGWVAAGLTEVLDALPEDHPRRERLLDHYRRMMRALLELQDDSGMWRQLLDEPEAWPEASCTGMFTYAFAVGVKKGWLGEEYAAAARRAWVALCGYLDENANVREVCVGTGQSDDKGYYLNRPRVTGDFHGQAATLWAATALSAPDTSGNP